MDRKELLQAMEEAMNRYDLTEEIEKSHIGEWQYGVSMVPCDWVYEYVKQPEIVRCKDCKWWDKKRDSPYGYCHACKHGHRSEHWEIGIYRVYKGDWFCADGERRDSENG